MMGGSVTAKACHMPNEKLMRDNAKRCERTLLKEMVHIIHDLK